MKKVLLGNEEYDHKINEKGEELLTKNEKDSNSSHLAWGYDIYCKTGIRISFPIIADRNGKIARKYRYWIGNKLTLRSHLICM